MAKSLVEMAAEIIAAQASQSRMTPEEIAEGLQKTYSALQGIQSREEGGPEAVEGKPPRRVPSASIQRNKVICLECGGEFKQLSKSHLKAHGLDPKSYKEKYGISSDTSLTAKSLSAKRRKVAKELGLGTKRARARKKGARR